jgi:hypothetical protein
LLYVVFYITYTIFLLHYQIPHTFYQQQ